MDEEKLRKSSRRGREVENGKRGVLKEGRKKGGFEVVGEEADDENVEQEEWKENERKKVLVDGGKESRGRWRCKEREV